MRRIINYALISFLILCIMSISLPIQCLAAWRNIDGVDTWINEYATTEDAQAAGSYGYNYIYETGLDTYVGQPQTFASENELTNSPSPVYNTGDLGALNVYNGEGGQYVDTGNGHTYINEIVNSNGAAYAKTDYGDYYIGNTYNLPSGAITGENANQAYDWEDPRSVSGLGAGYYKDEDFQNLTAQMQEVENIGAKLNLGAGAVLFTGGTVATGGLAALADLGIGATTGYFAKEAVTGIGLGVAESLRDSGNENAAQMVEKSYGYAAEGVGLLGAGFGSKLLGSASETLVGKKAVGFLDDVYGAFANQRGSFSPGSFFSSYADKKAATVATETSGYTPEGLQKLFGYENGFVLNEAKTAATETSGYTPQGLRNFFGLKGESGLIFDEAASTELGAASAESSGYKLLYDDYGQAIMDETVTSKAGGLTTLGKLAIGGGAVALAGTAIYSSYNHPQDSTTPSREPSDIDVVGSPVFSEASSQQEPKARNQIPQSIASAKTTDAASSVASAKSNSTQTSQPTPQDTMAADLIKNGATDVLNADGTHTVRYFDPKDSMIKGYTVSADGITTTDMTPELVKKDLLQTQPVADKKSDTNALLGNKTNYSLLTNQSFISGNNSNLLQLQFNDKNSLQTSNMNFLRSDLNTQKSQLSQSETIKNAENTIPNTANNSIRYYKIVEGKRVDITDRNEIARLDAIRAARYNNTKK